VSEVTNATRDGAEVRAQAEALAADGRFLAAAKLLETLGRDERDPMIDMQIVELRHRAFAELPREGIPSVNFDPPPPDPWPDERGAPVVPADELTAETLAAAIHHHGCVIVRGVFDADTCAAFRDDIDRSLIAFDDFEMARPLDTAPWYAQFPILDGFVGPDPFGTAFLRQCGGAYAPYAPRAFVDYRNALERVGLLDLVEQHLGAVPVLSVNKFVLRKVSGGAEPAWHQDGGYLGVDSRALNLWVALSDCGGDTERMGLDILPGPRRELAEVGTHDAVERRAISQTVASEWSAAMGRPVSRPHFAEGDAILFDQYFIHRSDIRPLATERYAVESWFFTANDYPDHLVPVVAG
jgi:hypothetical protein